MNQDTKTRLHDALLGTSHFPTVFYEAADHIDAQEARIAELESRLALAQPRAKVSDAEIVENIRDKWKMVDADCRDGANGLMTYHINAFDEGRALLAAQGESICTNRYGCPCPKS